MDRCVHACCCGHFVIRSHYAAKDELCELCGYEMIDRCPECGTIVKEWDLSGVFNFSGSDDMLPAYCANCGNPYPWTVEALKMVAGVLEEETELSGEEQEHLIAAMPDILAETPNTTATVELFRSTMLSGGEHVAGTLRGIVRECGCRAAKRQLGL